MSNFAHYCSNEFANRCNETVFIGPAGTCMPKGFHCAYKVVEDEKSQPSAGAGKKGYAEFERIEDLFARVIKRYSLNRIFLFHPFYYGPPAASVSENLGIPFEVVVHGTELTSQFPEALGGHGDIEPRDTDSLQFHLYSTMRRARRVVANSRYTGAIAKNIVPEALVIVSGCGISADTFAAARARSAQDSLKKMRRRASGGSDRPQLCFVGRLVRHKRIDKIFELQSIMDADLIIVGEGPLKEELQAQAVLAGVDDKVRFVGQASDDRKWEVLGTSDFLILPSDLDDVTGGYEGFGIVLLEAIAAGTIPVCSGACGTADPVHLFGLGIEGLSTEKDSQATMQSMIELLSDAEKYKSKLDRDTATVQENLLWPNIADNIIRGWRDA